MTKYQKLLPILETGSEGETYRNVRRLRTTREGRAQLRDMGKSLDKNILDSTSRDFIGWDGEGITYHPDTPQSYVLFGASTGQYVIGRSLGTYQCLSLMLGVKTANPLAIHVGFSISYDAEMILRDLSEEELKELITNASIKWHGFRIEYLPKKWFQVSGGNPKVTCRIWDIWSFFGCSFVVALKKYVPEIPQSDLDRIITGKGQRNKFKTSELESQVVPYWKTELAYIVLLANRLRELLHEAGLFPRMWHGPAAVANYLNKANGTKEHMSSDLPYGVLVASQYGYAAGRVEQYKVGMANSKIYKYDLRSAYPAAMTLCPDLNHKWSYRESDSITDIQSFALYFIDYDSMASSRAFTPQPLFHRTKDSYITFPRLTTGWYWGPEAENALASGCAVITAAWEMEMENATYPFAEWVTGMYEKRRAFKAQKIPAEWAIKLGLNSLYGKTAQRAGYERAHRIPEWHQLEWAGYITSYTRARMYRAALLAGDSIFGMETDAIFTTAPVDGLDIGESLGQWDYETYMNALYLQTGVYWMQDNDGEWHSKFRGMDKETLNLDMALSYLENTSLNVANSDQYMEQPMTGMTRTRFVGSRAAMHVGRMEDWRKWKTEPVKLVVGKSFKRIHVPLLCTECKAGNYYAHDRMHDMVTSLSGIGPSFATKLPWRQIDGEAAPWTEFTDDPSFIPE